MTLTRIDPWTLSARQWSAALRRCWTEAGNDNISLVAAGTAFYAFAAIVPLLAAIVLTYGLVADAETVTANIRALFGVLPDEAATLIGDQLAAVVETSGGKKGLGLVVALLLALYGATKGTSSMVTALNIAYEERERRGFVRLYLLYFAMVAGAVVLVLTAVASSTLLALLGDLLPDIGGVVVTLIRLSSYLVLGLIVVTGAALLYRFAPSHRAPHWRWLSPGAVIASALWLVATTGFGIYAANFGNYGATYGSLSAVIVLLTWLWLSAYVFLLGAELNSVLEPDRAAPPQPAPVDRNPAPAPPPVARPARPPARRPIVSLPAALLAGYGLGRIRKRRVAGVLALGGAARLIAKRWDDRPR